MRFSFVCAARAACAAVRGRRADLQVLGRRSQGRDRGRRARIPGRWRSCRTAGCWSPSGPAGCGSRARRQALAAARRRAEGLRRPARAGCTTWCSTAISRKQHDLFLLRRARAGRRAHRDGPRALDDGKLDDVKVIFQQDGPLSSGNHFGCRIAQAPDGNLFLTHGRPLHPSRRGAEPRQPHRQDRPHRARRRGAARTIRSSAVPTPSRKSGATATATRRARRSIPRPASCGSTSTARAAATRSTFREKGKNYGWPVIGYGIDYSGAKIHESTASPAWSSR